jgi:lactoylglutathione lyase
VPLPIRSLFETHLTVAGLPQSMAFYGGVLGLELARVFPERQVAFYWIGGPGKAMLGLWGTGSGPLRMKLHLAFGVDLGDLAWMPAAAVYFEDPDGHQLEFLAMLSDAPRPEWGVLAWTDWRRRRDGDSPPPGTR